MIIIEKWNDFFKTLTYCQSFNTEILSFNETIDYEVNRTTEKKVGNKISISRNLDVSLWKPLTWICADAIYVWLPYYMMSQSRQESSDTLLSNQDQLLICMFTISCFIQLY